LDASVLHHAFAACPENIPVFGVHDCVGSNAEHIDFVADQYRSAFVQLFRDKNYLREFAAANEFDLSQLDKILPPFDMELHNKIVDSISASRYFLS
jgi:DNA-directed RNA polymerase